QFTRGSRHLEMRSKSNRFGLEGGARGILYSERPHYRRRARSVRHRRENALSKMRALLASSRNRRSKYRQSRFVRPLRKRRRVGKKNGGASSCESVKNAMPEFAIHWRDVLLHVLDARNADLQSVRPTESYSAECAPNSSAPRAGEVAAGYKPAWRTGQRPVLHRNTDLQSVRPAEFHSAEPAADRQLCL